MVHGLKKFKEYFEEYSNYYVFIGGTACDILMEELGVAFRGTKDLDIVLIVEALDNKFGERFCQFIEDGGYEHRNKSTGKNQFYRFSKPTQKDYPKMIELFSRKSNQFQLKFDNGLTPIHIDDNVISLSAILLNDAYYNILIKGKTIIDGFSLIEIETVIIFKIKAWLDLQEKVKNGEHVDSHNISKHKNDVFRLLANVLPSSKVEITEAIKDDIKIFIEMVEQDRPDLRNLKITETSFDEMIELIKKIFLI